MVSSQGSHPPCAAFVQHCAGLGVELHGFCSPLDAQISASSNVAILYRSAALVSAANLIHGHHVGYGHTPSDSTSECVQSGLPRFLVSCWPCSADCFRVLVFPLLSNAWGLHLGYLNGPLDCEGPFFASVQGHQWGGLPFRPPSVTLLRHTALPCLQHAQTFLVWQLRGCMLASTLSAGVVQTSLSPFTSWHCSADKSKAVQFVGSAPDIRIVSTTESFSDLAAPVQHASHAFPSCRRCMRLRSANCSATLCPLSFPPASFLQLLSHYPWRKLSATLTISVSQCQSPVSPANDCLLQRRIQDLACQSLSVRGCMSNGICLSSGRTLFGARSRPPHCLADAPFGQLAVLSRGIVNVVSSRWPFLLARGRCTHMRIPAALPFFLPIRASPWGFLFPPPWRPRVAHGLAVSGHLPLPVKRACGPAACGASWVCIPSLTRIFDPLWAQRVGEALHPGPNQDVVKLAVVNPTAIHRKESELLELQADILCVSETSAVVSVQAKVAATLRQDSIDPFLGIPFRPAVPTRNRAVQFGGSQEPFSIFTTLPARVSPTAFSPKMLATTRVVETFLRLGALEVRCICLYGIPRSHVDASTLNSWLLEAAFERITQSRVPALIAGDMNCDVTSLEIWSRFQQLGYVEAFQAVAARFQIELPPTCKNSTRFDTAILAPSLASLLQGAQVCTELHSFDAHDTHRSQ